MSRLNFKVTESFSSRRQILVCFTGGSYVSYISPAQHLADSLIYHLGHTNDWVVKVVKFGSHVSFLVSNFLVYYLVKFCGIALTHENTNFPP